MAEYNPILSAPQGANKNLKRVGVVLLQDSVQLLVRVTKVSSQDLVRLVLT